MEPEFYKPGLASNQSLVDQLKEVQQNPASIKFIELARSYRKEGLVHQALQILDEGMEFHPNLGRAHLEKAHCSFELRRYADCLRHLYGILQTNPDNIKAQRLQAKVYEQLKQTDAAVSAYRNVLQLNEFDFEAREYIEKHEKQPPAPLLEDEYEQPECVGKIADFQVSVSSGESLSLEHKISSSLESDSESDPNSEGEESTDEPFATRTIAELYLRQGLNGKALKIIRKILEKSPADEWARNMLSELGPSQKELTANTPSQAKMAKAAWLERILQRIQDIRTA